MIRRWGVPVIVGFFIFIGFALFEFDVPLYDNVGWGAITFAFVVAAVSVMYSDNEDRWL